MRESPVPFLIGLLFSIRSRIATAMAGGTMPNLSMPVSKNLTLRAVLGPRIVAVGFLLVLAGCTLISPYDPTSYKNATDLKVESLVLIDKATDPPASHKAEIEALQIKLRQAYEYEKGKAENSETEQQWAIMVSPDRNLMGGFMKKWLDDNTAQSPAFLAGMKSNVEAGFDTIIKLENGKVRK